MKMQFTAVLVGVLGMLAAGQARAQAPEGPAPGSGPGAMGEAFQKNARLMRTLAIGEALGLDDAGTLKLRDQLARFDAQREPLQRQIMDQSLVLRRAAKGDTTAYGQVDGAIQKILALRSQIEQLDRALFTELSAGLSPDKKARLALVMARLPHQMREMARGKGGQ